MHRPSVRALLVGAIPVTAMCLSISLWNRVHPFIFGLPFNIFWIISWIILTPVCMSVAYRIETAIIKAKAAEKKGIERHD